MEKNFIKVRSFGNILVSFSFMLAGIACLYFPASDILQLFGGLLLLAGVLLGWWLKTDYKDPNTGERFKKKVRNYSCGGKEYLQTAIADPEHFDSSRVGDGQQLKLTILYSRKQAYLQLSEYVPHSYVPCSEAYCHGRDKVSAFIG